MQYSKVMKSDLDSIQFRLDAEYYLPECLNLERLIKGKQPQTIRDMRCILDCSAFYPSVTSYYDSESTGIPFLRVNEIRDGLVKLTDNTVFLPESILNENPKTMAKTYPGDIIIAKGGNTVAKIGLVSDSYNKYATSRDLIILRTQKLEGINKFYLWIFLHSNIGKNMLLRTASQTGQPHLTLEAIYQLEVPKLSGVFQDYFEILYAQSLQYKDLENALYRQAEERLLEELGLRDWRPQHALSFVRDYAEVKQAERFDAEYFQPKYQHVIEAIKQHDYFFIANIENHNRRGVQPEYVDDGEIKVVTSKHIGAVTIDYDNLDRTTRKAWDENKTAQIKQNDILIYTTGANVGRTQCYLDTSPTLASNHVNILRLNKLNPIYAGLFINSLLGQLQVRQNVSGSAQVELYPSDISKFIIWNAPDKTQDEIANMVIQSKDARQTSKQLLEIAKRAVEMAIEQDEQSAESWLREEVRKLGTELI